MLAASGLTLVSSAEVANSEVLPALASAFIGAAAAAPPQAGPASGPGAVALEEELDDMA